MPLIHSWQEILDLGDDWLTPAERALIADCKAGEPCVLDDGALPPKGAPGPDREIRAEVLRYLILGGCDTVPVRGWGLQLWGGHVTGDLDLSFARAQGATMLISCRFDQPVSALQTRFEALALTNSILPDLNMQGARVTGHVFSRQHQLHGRGQPVRGRDWRAALLRGRDILGNEGARPERAAAAGW